MILSEEEKDFIATLEETEQQHAAGDVIIDSEALDAPIFIVKEGWLVARTDFKGKSSISRIFLPGEIVGLAELGADNSGHETVMQTDGTVCPFPRDAVSKLFGRLPRLASLLMSVSGVDQTALRDKQTAMAIYPGEDRLIHFFLDLRARLAVANVGTGNRFRIPMSQAEIGQAIGTTPVYVNRMMQDFIRRGRIQVERPYYRLLDREEMERQIAFRDRYAVLDTSWFPPAPEERPAR
ncbi:Crp/Fnr family transcriptional regulator [Roseicyclus sp. F158]|uniref:Crp/Fnr family transcriptional regulator n=1 Tax=Tropicimonas omnivorans TaxID=3075590 RepID=A0ABU3DHY5_9RHOB|nr:Crp/Fnr family transcriptional regulator [Roseicyclus sp. F158]MDT0682767.1 Crp/Fnr family transcriptional regulator [Roseicyclus sp. F158]